MSLISLSGACLFLIILITLHFLKREFDPSWRMISEYEIGRHGWLMRMAFVCLSISCIALVIVLWKHVSVVGSVLFAIASIGPLGAAIFETDPITTPRSSTTFSSLLHNLFGTLFIFGFPISITVMSFTAEDQLLGPFHPWLLWMCIVVWIGLLTFMGSTAFFGRSKGMSGPQVSIGWQNRFMMLTYLAWISVVALFTCYSP